MTSDLAMTMFLGALALVIVSALAWWVARCTRNGTLKPFATLGLHTKSTRHSPQAWAAGHQAAAPFLNRYAVILTVISTVVIVLAFVSDLAALVVYLIELLVFALAVAVVRRQANMAAERAYGSAAAARSHDDVPRSTKNNTTTSHASGPDDAPATQETPSTPDVPGTSGDPA